MRQAMRQAKRKKWFCVRLCVDMRPYASDGRKHAYAPDMRATKKNTYVQICVDMRQLCVRNNKKQGGAT